MKKTLRVYFRPDARCSQARQDAAAAKYDGKIIAYTDIGEWFLHLRSGEVGGVPFFHRLASGADELQAVRDRLKAAGIIVLETDTGRRSDNAHDQGDMVQEALALYAQRNLSKAEAKALAALGADASPVTKSRTDRMPLELAEEILNDHKKYPTLKIALRALNNATDARGKKFKRKYNLPFIYRMAKMGKLKLVTRRSGPKVKR